MKTNNDPVIISVKQSVNLIRQYAAAAEQKGQLHPEQLKRIFEQNWFNLYVPATSGGLELSLPEAVRVLEYLAYTDASTGWTVTLCSGANWFIGFMDQSIRDTFFANQQVCLSGSGAASGKAVHTENGYTINGFWKYATGAPHATAFTANCVIEQSGKLLRNEDGTPLVKSFIFDKDEVEIYPDWNTTGMRATASHSFKVTGLNVPANRCFVIDPGHITLPHPIFLFPFASFSEVTIAANLFGIAYHFAKECKIVFNERIKRHDYELKDACEMLELLGREKSKLQDARQKFYSILEKTWTIVITEKQPDSFQLKQLNEACRSVVKQARHTVNNLYPYCGMSAAYTDSDINRIWRDFHTASLHAIFTFGCA